MLRIIIRIIFQYKKKEIKMRFIVMYKYGILQSKTERIDVNFCEDTTQLLDFLEKKVQQKASSFIVKFKKGKSNLRILPGWKIDHYGLIEGTELQIELVETVEEKKEIKNTTINNKYLNNVLGLNKVESGSITEIKEQQQQEEQDEQFNVRKYLDKECQKLLKEIQNANLQGFLQIFQDYPESVDEDLLLELQNKKPLLIDELGEKGWGAIHYAIYLQIKPIFFELLDMDVDVNKCTSDGWLPIQLAINLKSHDFIQALLDEPSINLNLLTSRGTPLHTVAKLADKDILQMILTKEIDIHIKDNTGKTAIEVCMDQECIDLIKKYEQKKQNFLYFSKKGSLPISLATIVKGQVLKIKKPFMSLKQRYLLIDPFQNSLVRFESKQDYPKKPIQINTLSTVTNVRLLQQSEKSWHMKKQYFYFQIQQPKLQVYACKYRNAAITWIESINLAIKYALEFEKNPKLLININMRKNEIVIEDKQFQMMEKPSLKKTKRNIFAFSMASSIRNSVNSVKSGESVQRFKSANNNHQKKEQHQNNQKQHSADQTKASFRVQQRKNQIQKQKTSLSQDLKEITTEKVNFASFTIMNTLGSGAFGKVFLVKHNSSGKLYALKALKKKNLILQKQLKYAIVQANILKQANHPFIINLHYAFQTPHYLYLALDYCPGRDLSFHLARQVTFSQDESRFYIAELLLAIEHLHNKKIVYRDLKPENILLDQKGHIKLADFGLSKQTNDEKTKSFCGSPAYLSPEMLSQKGAGKQSDLYGVGAVLYQFLIGEPPYFSDDIPTLYRNIKQGKLKFPKGISENAKSLILGLLERDPKKRLGSKGIYQIKQHQFFASINWEKLQKVQIQPPKRPQLDDGESSDDDADIIKQDKKKFTDFDYDENTKKINRLINFSFIRQ